MIKGEICSPNRGWMTTSRVWNCLNNKPTLSDGRPGTCPPWWLKQKVSQECDISLGRGGVFLSSVDTQSLGDRIKGAGAWTPLPPTGGLHPGPSDSCDRLLTPPAPAIHAPCGAIIKGPWEDHPPLLSASGLIRGIAPILADTLNKHFWISCIVRGTKVTRVFTCAFTSLLSFSTHTG